jgi:ubiquinone/menaquinone biosynthesis C-methylase UbiE
MNGPPMLEGKSTKSLIEESAQAFDAELHTPAYTETHSDASQLDRQVSALCAAAPQNVLDLGTGNGYVAMETAKRLPRSLVVGLDVAAGAIDNNKSTASSRGITNVAFQVCDGISLPFQDNWFEGAVCRYAFHHMPRPDITLSEISRVLHHRGRFVFADAVRDNQDSSDFINAFQELKRDGHVEMLRSDELVSMFQHHGFQLEDHFETSLTFDRTRTAEYDALIKITPKTILDRYNLSVENHRLILTFPIFNAVFANIPIA